MSGIPGLMKAVVIHAAGGPEVLEIEHLPIPSAEFGRVMPLQQLVDRLASGTLRVQIGKVFKLDDIVEAHRTMDANAAGGKIVVLT
ncbi:MAG: zinc-binding dehydrogenase [Candidatus Eremiobacteraeota bacterium]|nr:zinc-binding dehydrogenase [Candidatus Eremiobacteraeota bacterium]